MVYVYKALNDLFMSICDVMDAILRLAIIQGFKIILGFVYFWINYGYLT